MVVILLAIESRAVLARMAVNTSRNEPLANPPHITQARRAALPDPVLVFLPSDIVWHQGGYDVSARGDRLPGAAGKSSR